VSEACQHLNIHLIHLSTDFIFDGKNGPYAEDDEPNPLSHYGRSKLKSELIVKQGTNPWSIVRTVLVLGVADDMSRSNIVLWAKSSLEKGKSINVVSDQYRTPTLAEDLAQGCMLIARKKATGVYNISGKDFMSVNEMVQHIAAHWHLDHSLIKEVSTENLNQAAKRPPITGFILEKAMSELGYNPHSFKETLAVIDQQLQKKKQ
jgi:dTDP-4-dehydrorhamnose reductase